MNLPLPDLDQPLLAYGGAASMVHPATGYQVGAALKRAPAVAASLAQVLDSASSPEESARAGWQALWPPEEVRKRALYRFGLQSLLRLDSEQTNEFFAAFFQLPRPLWTGYLSNTLDEAQIRQTMLRLFASSPNRVRAPLMQTALAEPGLLRKGLWR